MSKFRVNWLVKLTAILLASIATGLAFGLLPCYVFPAFGADPHSWCGYKSEPPHFLIQCSAGFLIAFGVGVYWSFRKR